MSDRSSRRFRSIQEQIQRLADEGLRNLEFAETVSVIGPAARIPLAGSGYSDQGAAPASRW